MRTDRTRRTKACVSLIHRHRSTRRASNIAGTDLIVNPSCRACADHESSFRCPPAISFIEPRGFFHVETSKDPSPVCSRCRAKHWTLHIWSTHYTVKTKLFRDCFVGVFSLCRDYNCDSTAIRLRSDYDVSRAPASIRRDSTRAKNEQVSFSS